MHGILTTSHRFELDNDVNDITNFPLKCYWKTLLIRNFYCEINIVLTILLVALSS